MFNRVTDNEITGNGQQGVGFAPICDHILMTDIKLDAIGFFCI